VHSQFCVLCTGIQYLREFLHLPQEIVPATLKRPQRQEASRPKPRGYGEGDRGAREELQDREGYRRTQQEKEVGLPSNPDIVFVSVRNVCGMTYYNHVVNIVC
jgi:small subunit ribosomal protein S10e